MATTPINMSTTDPSQSLSFATLSPTESIPVNGLDVIQDMIDCSADRLEGLRTQCVTSAILTQREIRSLETKLLRMFSELLLTKRRLCERLPNSDLLHTSTKELKQWLRVVGLSQESLNICIAHLSSLEELMRLCDSELKDLVIRNPNYRDEEVRRLTKAMGNLRICKEILSVQTFNKGNNDNKMEIAHKEIREQDIDQLFWDSWDRHQQQYYRGSIGNIATSSPRTQRMITKHSSIHQQEIIIKRQSPSSNNINYNNTSAICVSITPALSRMNNNQNTQNIPMTIALTPSPPNSPFISSRTSTSYCNTFSGDSLNYTSQSVKAGDTPPQNKKNCNEFDNSQSLSLAYNSLVPSSQYLHFYKRQQQFVEDGIPAITQLAKAEFDESHITDTSLSSTSTSVISLSSPIIVNVVRNIYSNNPRTRLNTDPSPDSHSSASSDNFIESSNSSNSNSLQVPLSPCTPIINLGMSHTIAHRFNTVFKMTSATCDLCQKPMFLGRKCKECKYRCHKLCEPDVPPSCCLPPEFIDEFKNAIKDQAGYHGTIQHTLTTLNTHSPVQNTVTYGTLSKNRMSVVTNRYIKSSTSGHPDSSSPASSCNSSSPSSPALFHIHNHQQHVYQHHELQNIFDSTTYGQNSAPIMSSSTGLSSSNTSSNIVSTPSSLQKSTSQFNFPDVTITANDNHITIGNSEMILSSQTINSSTSHDILNESLKSYNIKNESSLPISDTIHSILPFSSTCLSSSITANITPLVTTMAIGTIVKTTTTASSPIVISMTKNEPHETSAKFFQCKTNYVGMNKRAPLTEISDIYKSNDSDKTVSLSGSTSASTDSDRTPVRLDSTEDSDLGNWRRQNSMSLKEWDIPYNDLHMLEKIGQGRFGTVHRAQWHGSVAVKLLKEDYLDDEHMLEAFKLEVANFKKTRHENLVLFMGACMNPPYLAIVTSLCKGNTLHTHIHVRREKFVINKTTLIAQQITQGMGYLHARGIIHKDLRTKNIFLENGKVIITDFGLFSSTKLMYCNKGLGIPSSWLCYIAPELMRSLMPRKPSEEILPFSPASDIYSFGTVWYELLCGEFPFNSQSPEAVIWQVGRGMKQTLANLQTSRDVKDILMLCWHFTADDRPDFPKLLTLFERLPKKRLARSPSHPIQLSRSAEAIF